MLIQIDDIDEALAEYMDQKFWNFLGSINGYHDHKYFTSLEKNYYYEKHSILNELDKEDGDAEQAYNLMYTIMHMSVSDVVADIKNTCKEAGI